MGNHPSSHQPLERGGNGIRISKRERSSPGKRMDRLRRSFRDSFRRRKDSVPESSKPHQWQSDEHGVRAGTCQFHVKYLGCVEVFDSRGMQVCEEALKVLRNSKRRPIRAILHVSGDGLRVVEDETKGLIVDQTIEKVSFCAPDKNHEKGFSYICRDGTTKRWMCHGFLALKESGDRLSHAVGCAFAACLERKQRRDKECGVTMIFDHRTSTFTRSGSFRQQSLTERMEDSRERAIDVAPPVKPVHNPYAIERPHATPSMLERQGSFRGFSQLNQASPFKRSTKRQLSLRVNDLPSNLERTRSHSLEPSDLSRMPFIPNMIPIKPSVSPIPEISPTGHDSVSAMCQRIAQGLSLLSSSDDFNPIISQATSNNVVKKLFSSNISSGPLPVTNNNSFEIVNTQNASSSLSNNGNNNSRNVENKEDKHMSNISGIVAWNESTTQSPVLSSNHRLTPILNQVCNLSPVLPRTTPVCMAISSTIMSNTAPVCTTASIFETPAASPAFSSTSTSSVNSSVIPPLVPNRSPALISSKAQSIDSSNISMASTSPAPSSSSTIDSVHNAVPVIPIAPVQPVVASVNLPKPDQWLGSITSSVPQTQSQVPTTVPPVPAPRRAPPLQTRALSDPFDAGWADVRQTSATNPFVVSNTTQAFQVQL